MVTIYNAYFSWMQALNAERICFYKTSNGFKIPVSEVSVDAIDPLDREFDDLVSLGPVLEWVQTIERNQLDMTDWYEIVHGIIRSCPLNNFYPHPMDHNISFLRGLLPIPQNN